MPAGRQGLAHSRRHRRALSRSRPPLLRFPTRCGAARAWWRPRRHVRTHAASRTAGVASESRRCARTPSETHVPHAARRLAAVACAGIYSALAPGANAASVLIPGALQAQARAASLECTDDPKYSHKCKHTGMAHGHTQAQCTQRAARCGPVPARGAYPQAHARPCARAAGEAKRAHQDQNAPG